MTWWKRSCPRGRTTSCRVKFSASGRRLPRRSGSSSRFSTRSRGRSRTIDWFRSPKSAAASISAISIPTTGRFRESSVGSLAWTSARAPGEPSSSTVRTSVTMSPEVRFNNLSLGGAAPAPEIEAAIARVLASGWFILGPEVEAFEREIESSFDCGNAVGVGNGTDAITLALMAVGVGPGDEVVTTPLTAAFTALAVSRLGVKPVFADVEPETLTLSVESVAHRITSRTRVILPVHLYGNAADIEGMRALAEDHGLAVVEDACQAHGARHDGKSLGSIGRAGTFSFYPTKNLGALGDGGMVVTRDDEIAAKLKRLRNGGEGRRHRH